MANLTQPIKWHGGKGAFNGKLAKWIISLMPPHTHYVEPYFGGGSVLLHKNPEGVSEVVNDLDGNLSSFWRVLQDPEMFEQFRRRVEATPFCEGQFADAKAVLAESKEDSPTLDIAVAFFIRARQSRQGLMKDFATLSRNRTRRGMNEQVSSWLTAIDGLQDVHARLKRVVILNRDATDVITSQDGPHTCFYLDPPYLHETRATTRDYQYEMTAEQHEALLRRLTGIKGTFLLSGYGNALYERYATEAEWNCHEFEIPNNASSRSKKETKTELIWTNYRG